MKTRVLGTASPPDRAAAVTAAVRALRNGQPVALPTETVYGLAADALKPAAALKIFAAKERPRFDPLIVHVPAREWLAEITRLEGASMFLFDRLIAEFWPGPLTLVLPRSEMVPDVVTAGLRTVAVRMSASKLFGEIIAAFGRPLAAPSANRFGKISPTSAADVLDELGGRIPLIIDGGRTTLGIESTVVAVHNGEIEVLRRGPITAEQLRHVAPVTFAGSSNRPKAPGQLATHYAPATPLRLVTDASAIRLPTGKRCGLLAYHATETTRFVEIRRLSPNIDVAAADLFRLLRELDQARLDLIVAEEVPEIGIGSAINDRLRRAAAKRSL
ncbi:MAG: L-threonylcarbamoyladenylate synthase [Chthoniobacterales bacterium]